MTNSVQKGLGYRDIIYNIKTEKFFTFAEGDNYEELDIATGGVDSGGTGDRPTEPETGDLFWDIDLNQLVIWNGSSWEPVGGSAVKVPLALQQAGLTLQKKATSISTQTSMH